MCGSVQQAARCHTSCALVRDGKARDRAVPVPEHGTSTRAGPAPHSTPAAPKPHLVVLAGQLRQRLRALVEAFQVGYQCLVGKGEGKAGTRSGCWVAAPGWQGSEGQWTQLPVMAQWQA